MNRTRPLVVTGGLKPAAAVCPMCHTSASVTQDAIEAGGDWRCVRCGQHWDAARLATVHAYAGWAGDRGRVGRQGDHFAAMYGDAPVERLGGRP